MASKVQEFRQQFMKTTVYKLIDVKVHPKIIEVNVKSVESGSFGVTIHFYEKGYGIEDKDPKYITVEEGGKVSSYSFFIDPDKAQAALNHALTQRINILTEEVRIRNANIGLMDATLKQDHLEISKIK